MTYTYEELFEENLQLKNLLKEKNNPISILNSIADAVPDAIFLLNFKGDFLKFIPAEDFKSYVPPDFFIGKNIKDVFEESLSNKFFDKINLLINTKKIQKIQYSLLENNVENYYETRFISYFENNILAIVRNITDEKEIQIKLEAKNKLLTDILENMTDAFVSLDNSFCYTYMNEKAGKIFNRNPKEMIGKHIWTEFPEGIGEKFYLAYEKALQEQKSIQIEEYYPPYDKWFENRISPSKDGITIFFQDVTERKMFEKELQDKEEKFRALIENAPDAVILVSIDGKIKYASPAIKQLGYNEKDFLNLDPNELTHPEELPYVLETIQNVINNPNKSLTIEYRFKDVNNNWIWLESTFTNALNHKNIEGIIINSKGINDRKTAEKILQRSESKYRFLIENILDVVWILDIESMSFSFISPSIEKLLGYSVQETLSLKIEDMLSHKSFLESQNKIKIRLEDFIKTKQSKVYTDILEQIHKNGSTLWVELITYFRFNPENNKLEVIGTTRNINEKKLAEDKLKENQEKLEKIFQSSPDMIILSKISDGTILDVNNKFLSLTKHKKEEIIGKTTLDINLWANTNNRSEYINQLNNKGFVRNLEYDFLLKSGEKRNGLVSANILTINNEQCILGTVRDITEQKQVQIKLNNERIRLKNLLETIPDYIFLKDIDGSFILCNKKLANLLGIKEENIIGKNDFDFFPEEEAKKFRSLDKKVLDENKIITEIEWLQNPKGDRKELVQTIKSPMYDYNGELIGLLGISRDITDIYLAQKEIEENEKIYSAIVTQAQESISLIDPITNKFYKFNDSCYKNLGYTKEEFENLTLKDIDIEIDLTKLEYLKNINQGIVFETKHKHKNGNFIDVLISTRYLSLDDKKYFVAIWSDITERKLFEKKIRDLNHNLEKKVKERTKQLEIANKDLESFAYSVSHDLRSPLRHIDGFSKLLKKSVINPSDDSKRYFAKIEESALKMSRMIDDLLKFSRLGRKQLDLTNIDLNVIVKSVIDQLSPDIENRKIKFVIGNLPIVKGDSGLLQMVFENLISNAIKFTSKKDESVIEIGECQKNNTNVIYVKDNGAGFDMSYADKLFGVFQRLHTENEFSGTGIGLANVKQIIQKHGGSIFAESQVNQGATFYIFLKGNKNYDN